MTNQYKKAEKIDEKALKRRVSRRVFLTESAKASGAAAVVGTAAYKGLDYLAGTISSTMAEAEREIRRLALDVQALSGDLEQRLASETSKLKEHYTQGKLRLYEELGVATPAEISEFEKIIQTSEEFEAHYNFAERARIFKDRLDKRLLSLDEKLESYQPSAMQKLNDRIRSAFGRPSGEEGKKTRSLTRERLESLCKIYDTNEDNRRAEVEVMKKINEYLTQTPNLSEEEKGLLTFLKEQYEKGGKSQELKSFIRNYNDYGERNDALLKLRSSLTQAEELYGQIRQNKVYITKLQDLLKQGIALKQEVISKSATEFEAYKSQFKEKIKSLSETVDGIIVELKERGYDIETREDYVSKGTFARSLDRILRPIVYAGTAISAALAGGLTAYSGFKTRKVKKAQATVKQVVKDHDALVDDHNALLEQNQGLEEQVAKLKYEQALPNQEPGDVY